MQALTEEMANSLKIVKTSGLPLRLLLRCAQVERTTVGILTLQWVIGLISKTCKETTTQCSRNRERDSTLRGLQPATTILWLLTKEPAKTQFFRRKLEVRNKFNHKILLALTLVSTTNTLSLRPSANWTSLRTK